MPTRHSRTCGRSRWSAAATQRSPAPAEWCHTPTSSPGSQIFYLAQISARTGAGKTIVIDLFDPGDVGDKAWLQILSPDGNVYTPVDFNYTADSQRDLGRHQSGTNVTCIQTYGEQLGDRPADRRQPDLHDELHERRAVLPELVGGDHDPAAGELRSAGLTPPGEPPPPVGGRSSTPSTRATTPRPGRSASGATRSTWSCRRGPSSPGPLAPDPGTFGQAAVQRGSAVRWAARWGRVDSAVDETLVVSTTAGDPYDALIFSYAREFAPTKARPWPCRIVVRPSAESSRPPWPGARGAGHHRPGHAGAAAWRPRPRTGLLREHGRRELGQGGRSSSVHGGG